MNDFFFESINKKNIKNNDKIQESKKTLNNKLNKNDISPTNSNNSKSIKKIEKNKIKKLENENALLKRLLMAYRLKKSSIYIKSTEKNKKFNNYFIDKKLSALSANKPNNTIINNSNLSNMLTINNDFSLKNSSKYTSNAKSTLSNNLLDSILDKIPPIPKIIKKKNSANLSILLTDGNLGNTIKKSKDLEIRTNSKKNKKFINEIKINKLNTKIKKIKKIKMNSLYYKNNKKIINDRDILNLNKNNTLNNTGGISYHHNFEKRNNNCTINNNISFKRNKNLGFKSSHQSLKLENNNPIFVKMSNDSNNNINKNNTILKARKNKLKKDIKSFSKHSLGNTMNHINLQKTNSKKKYLFTEKGNIKSSKKKLITIIL